MSDTVGRDNDQPTEARPRVREAIASIWVGGRKGLVLWQTDDDVSRGVLQVDDGHRPAFEIPERDLWRLLTG